MGLLANLFAPDLRASWSPTDDRYYAPIPGVMTESGMRVDQDSAQRISAWYRGRDILATVLAMLPLQIYERLPNDGGADLASGNPLYDILHDKPNGWQDSFQWRRQKMYHLIDHGNAYDWIVSGRRGYVDQLQPIAPELVTPEQVASGPNKGRLVYKVRNEKTGLSTTHTQEEIFHLRGASSDGVAGVGILQAARTSLGTALATESYAAQIFGRGTLNGGVIENPGVLDGEASKRMAQSFISSTSNWHLPKVLEQGSKWVQNELTPEDAQMLLSRKFSIDDMARWLGVPRQMLENSDPSFGNAEQFDQNFITYSIGPWLSLFEFGIADQLILNPQRFFAQFNRRAFVRGKFSERIAGLVLAAGGPIMTRNEARQVEDFNTLEDPAYDELINQQNITGKPAADAQPADAPPAPVKPQPPADAKAEAIAVESAARLLRKEVAAVSALAVKHAANEDDFVAAVSAFYVKHAELVAQTLQVDAKDAEAYCAGQCGQILDGPWYAKLDLWREPNYAVGLAALALGEAA